MWTVWGINGWYLIIPICIILALIYFRFDIKPRNSAFETTGIILFVIGLMLVALLAIYIIIKSAIWINSNLGLAFFILIIFYILWGVFHYLVKHKMELLISIFGAYTAAKIKAFVAGMSILINTPIGFAYISLGSITWVGLLDSHIGQTVGKIITIPLPAWLWFVMVVILGFGITSMTKNFVKTAESSLESFFHLDAGKDNPALNAPSEIQED